MIYFYKKGNFMGVLAGHRSKDAEGGSDCIASAFNRQPDDVLGVEVIRVFGEAGAGGVLDALVNRKDGQITRSAEPPVADNALQIAQHARVPVRNGVEPVHDVRTRDVQPFFGNLWIFEVEEIVGLVAELL